MTFAADLTYDIVTTFFNSLEYATAVIEYRETSAGLPVAIGINVPWLDLGDSDLVIRRRFYWKASDYGTPDRGHKLIDAAGQVWTVEEVSQDIEGVYNLDAALAQARS